MAITEKFAALTPEQRENFADVKDAEALDAFIAEHGIELTDEEKTQAVAYFKTGLVELEDEELENVAGGGCYTEHGFLVVTVGYSCKHWKEKPATSTKYGIYGTCGWCWYATNVTPGPGYCNHPENMKQ